MQRIDGRDHRLLGRRPARRIRRPLHRGADLLVGEMCGGGEGRDVHAPFIFARVQRAGAVDHDLALPQGERSAIQETAGAEFLPGPRMPRHHPEQHQRRRAAHDAVELLLNAGRVRRIERCDA